MCASPSKIVLYRIRRGQPEDVVSLQYNPTELSLEQIANWRMALAPGGIIPSAQFVNSEVGEMVLDVFLYNRGDNAGRPRNYVEQMINRLRLFAMPGAAFTPDYPRRSAPAGVRLHIPGREMLHGVVPKVEVTEKLHHPDMVPYYAEVKVHFVVTSRGFDIDYQYVREARRKAGLEV